MKTIEERAREANPFRGISLYAEYEGGLCVGWDNGYIKGATEQKAIDENEWKNKIAALKKWLSDDSNNAIVNEGQMGFVDIYDLLMFINNGFKAIEE